MEIIQNVDSELKALEVDVSPNRTLPGEAEGELVKLLTGKLHWTKDKGRDGNSQWSRTKLRR
jgi:hypothetical protein